MRAGMVDEPMGWEDRMGAVRPSTHGVGRDPPSECAEDDMDLDSDEENHALHEQMELDTDDEGEVGASLLGSPEGVGGDGGAGEDGATNKEKPPCLLSEVSPGDAVGMFRHAVFEATTALGMRTTVAPGFVTKHRFDYGNKTKRLVRDLSRARRKLVGVSVSSPQTQKDALEQRVAQLRRDAKASMHADRAAAAAKQAVKSAEGLRRGDSKVFWRAAKGEMTGEWIVRGKVTETTPVRNSAGNLVTGLRAMPVWHGHFSDLSAATSDCAKLSVEEWAERAPMPDAAPIPDDEINGKITDDEIIPYRAYPAVAHEGWYGTRG